MTFSQKGNNNTQIAHQTNIYNNDSSNSDISKVRLSREGYVQTVLFPKVRSILIGFFLIFFGLSLGYLVYKFFSIESFLIINFIPICYIFIILWVINEYFIFKTLYLFKNEDYFIWGNKKYKYDDVIIESPHEGKSEIDFKKTGEKLDIYYPLFSGLGSRGSSRLQIYYEHYLNKSKV